MGMIENDPRDIGYIALYTAIKWYQHLSSESALRIVRGRSHTLRGQKLTPEMLEEIKKIMDSPNFYNINTVVRKFRVNKYEILEAIAGKSVEVVEVVQTEKLLKRLKDVADNCTAADCEKCQLDRIICGEYTLCETLSDVVLDKQGRLDLKRVRPKSDQSPTIEDLSGEIIKKTYKLHKNAVDEMQKYKAKRPRETLQDIVSLALLEYTSRHKRT